MRNFLLGALLVALIAFAIKHFIDQSNTQKIEIESSGLILDQIKNVGKLVVTEGHFSDIITYKDDKTYFKVLSSKKKIIVMVNANVQVSYDLRKIEHTIDQETKTLTITNIPKAEININPEIKYHDINEGLINKFEAEDHNVIRKIVVEKLNRRVQKSSLVTNSQNRLISELQKIYILTNSLGWTLKYKDTAIDSQISFEELIAL
ncbi:DUF4230 domain-containing protein [Aquimarina algiphila]|uniref:DUF4230 domain-containing protein n=1 Tax=Aquimarina algiphila TaxID=2047982 RepID=A0A554VGS7_9FLAO|nr:DUF4230 domain-containing protein [Aquimarina algiphila]TSE06628.1 DUF4230 domain-containing protein [Aquimarina algiphila]